MAADILWQSVVIRLFSIYYVADWSVSVSRILFQQRVIVHGAGGDRQQHSAVIPLFVYDCVFSAAGRSGSVGRTCHHLFAIVVTIAAHIGKALSFACQFDAAFVADKIEGFVL